MTLSRAKLFVLICIAVAVLIIAWYYLSILRVSSTTLLTERPPRTESAYAAKSTQSFLGVSLEIPYSILVQAAEQSIDDKEKVEVSGKTAGANYRGKIFLRRITPVVIVPNDQDSLSLSTTLQFAGSVGFLGGIARTLGMDNMNVDGTVTLKTRIELGMYPDWTPRVAVSLLPSVWEKPPSIEVLHTTVTFKNKANQAIENAAKKLPEKINAAIAKLNLQEKAQKAWRVYRLQLNKQSTLDNAAIDIVPVSAHISGIHYLPQQIQLAMALGVLAKVNLGNTPLPSPPTLPNIQTLSDSPVFLLNIPIFSDYALLEKMILARLSPAPIKVDTPQGPLSVAIKNVEIYPSADQLAIGLNFQARSSNRVLNAQGEVFLLTTPRLDRSGKKVFFDSIHIYKNIDNSLWTIYSDFFSDNIAKSLEGSAQFELTPKIDELERTLQSRLAEMSANSKICLRFSDESLKLSEISTNANRLLIEARLQGKLFVSTNPCQPSATAGQTHEI